MVVAIVGVALVLRREGSSRDHAVCRAARHARPRDGRAGRGPDARRSHGLPADDPVVLATAHVVVHLAPAPVVAKAAASSRTVRAAGAFLARELEVAAAMRAAGLPVVAASDAVPARVPSTAASR